MNSTIFDNRDDKVSDAQLRRELELNDIIEKRLGLLEKIGRQKTENVRQTELGTARENERHQKQAEQARHTQSSVEPAGRGWEQTRLARPAANMPESAMKMPGAPAGMAGGAISMAGGVATAATAMFEVARSVAILTTNLANIGQNSSLSGTQKSRSIAREMHMGWAVDLADAADGTTERLRKLSEETHPKRMAQVEIESQERQVTDKMISDRHVANYRADLSQQYAKRVADKKAPIIDRSTAAGERQHQEAETMRPLQMDLEKAEIEAKVAQRQSELLRKDIARSQSIRDETLKHGEKMNLRARNEDFGTDNEGKKRSRWEYVNVVAEQAEGRSEAEASGKDAENRSNELMQKRQQLQQADAAAAQAAFKAEEARTNVMRGQLQIMEARERKHASSSRNLGAMNPLERQMALDAVKLFRANKNNPDAMLPEQLRHVAALIPDELAAAETKIGEAARRESGVDTLGVGDNKTLDERRKEIQETQAKIDVKVAFDESMLAKKMAEALAGLAEKISADFKVVFGAAVQQIMARQGLSNAQPK